MDDDEPLPIRPSLRGLDLDGRTGLVMGATGSLGPAIVSELLDHGARVFVHGGRNRSALDALCATSGLTGQLADVTDPAAIAALFDQVSDWCDGELGFLVYCPGVNPSASVTAEIDVDHWDATQAVNVRGAYLSLVHALPLLRDGDPGKIVLISSVFGVDSPAHRAAYGASKHALHGLVQSVGREEGTRVHINALCPGPAAIEKILGTFGEHARARGISVEEYARERTRHLPAGRFLEPSELARVTALFCSRATDYISGQVIKVTGGA